LLKGIIFDFDGVIAESVQVKTDAFAELYKPYGSDIVKKVVDHHETNGSMSRFEKIHLYHESFLNKTITGKEIATLANQFSDLVVEKVIDTPYVPGALEYIKKSFKQYKLFISTGTPTEEIKQILIGRKIKHYFTGVYGSPEKKSAHLNQIISEYNFKPDELIFYGDSNTDIEAAAYHNIRFVLRVHKFNNSDFNISDDKIIENFLNIGYLFDKY